MAAAPGSSGGGGALPAPPLPVPPCSLQLSALSPAQRAHLQRALALPPLPRQRRGLWGLCLRYQAWAGHDCLVVASTLAFVALWGWGQASAAWSAYFAAVFTLHWAVGVGASGPCECPCSSSSNRRGAAAAGAAATHSMIGAALQLAPNFTFAALSWLEFAANFVPFLQASALSRLTMVRCWAPCPASFTWACSLCWRRAPLRCWACSCGRG